MKIAICDDMEQERLCIKKHCETNGYSDITLFHSGEELLSYSHLEKINLLFLDIELEGITGIEIMHKLEFSSPHILIVFCTSHQELMPDAFGRNVISFLSKPYKELSIKNCIKKAACLTKEFYPVTIDKETSVPCRNILYLKSEQKYTIFFDTQGNHYLSRKSLKDWCEQLAIYGFSPISRSIAVNLKYIKKIRHNKVLLATELELEISRRYASVLKQNYDTYILHLMRNET